MVSLVISLSLATNDPNIRRPFPMTLESHLPLVEGRLVSFGVVPLDQQLHVPDNPDVRALCSVAGGDRTRAFTSQQGASS